MGTGRISMDLALMFQEKYNSSVRMFYFNTPKIDRGHYLNNPGLKSASSMEVGEEFTKDSENFRGFLEKVATALKLVPCPGIMELGGRKVAGSDERVKILCERKLHMHAIVDKQQLSIQHNL